MAMTYSSHPSLNIRVEKYFSLSHFKNVPFYLPNSVCVFNNSRIAIADGGNNRICVFSHDGKPFWQHCEYGFFPSGMREPIFVYAASLSNAQNDFLLVSDWHNNRLLVFKPDYSFSHTLFHIGPIYLSRGLKNYFFLAGMFLKNIAIWRVNAPYYFTPEKMKDGKSKSPDYSLSVFLKGISYYFFHLNEVKSILTDRNFSVRKIDGIVVQNNQLILSQKANRCVSIYNIDQEDLSLLSLERHISEYAPGQYFGRICNLCSDQDKNIYVCDQENKKIVILRSDYSFIRSITFETSPQRPMAPFSCAVIDNRFLAVAFSFGFDLLDMNNNDQVVYSKNDLGETHGIAWDKVKRRLYYVDRSNSVIEVFSVTMEHQD